MEAVNRDIEKLQLIEFNIGDNNYGVNILKVKEIISPRKIVSPPNLHRYIKGVFNYRGQIIPVLNMHYILKSKYEQTSDSRIVVLLFNNALLAVEVDSVVGTFITTWDNIKQIEAVPNKVEEHNYTGIITMKDRMIMILDFEGIVLRIAEAGASDHEEKLRMDEAEQPDEKVTESKPIEEMTEEELFDVRGKKIVICAEDSKLMARLIKDSLEEAGYRNIMSFKDGKEIMEYLDDNKEGDMFILDIEMPFHNGYTVTKKIKSDEMLKDRPVVLFSSLINDESINKGIEAGADLQVSKPDVSKLVETLDTLL